MNRIDEINKKIVDLKKYREQVLRIKQLEDKKNNELNEDTSLKNSKSNKIIRLVNDNKKAGYVDMLILSFILASSGIAILLFALTLINMSRF